MNDFIRGEFKFDTKTVEVEKYKKNPNVTFRIPVPLGNLDLNQESQPESLPYKPPDSLFSQNQHSVNVRIPFKNLIERKIPDIEKLFQVRMSLQDVDGDLKLIASGEKAEPSINEIIDICRKSNVYNFYLCFPVRGDQFHKSFSEFQKSVKNKLGGNVTFEKRPHVTLALVNLVTDSDIYNVVRALQITSLTITSVLKQQSQNDHNQYYVDLEGLDFIKYKGKFAKRSVLFTNVVMSEALSDIATEFQNTLNKTVNGFMDKPKKRKINKSNRISNLTESQLAPKGIYLSRGGTIEISFTDVPLVDPNYMKTNPNKQTQGEETSTSESNEPETQEQELEMEMEKKESESDEEENYEYDTSVKNKFHVTLMRHQHVNILSNLKFSTKTQVVCAELRPRRGETCNFNSYNSGELASFVGTSYDNEENEDNATRICSARPSNIPNDHLVDMDPENNNKAERFLFWI
ncbi:uncharacterized protein TA19795 [Theileria annulata]|uniref:A-kinase anchor protein 7-like phosphoesterase domain-containing protein n=1 Tax=Theileria annulata TaxID=5874 RepID=Q4UG05_THEAN|nr:uncharacterized protein TA19795 [Theileria annulata]CAI73984.1 hypothetical protein TA19795 [Theileria annulata]|eukprot:XP_954664.1 hypothetical protein TA19795 [Theileria annulata]